MSNTKRFVFFALFSLFIFFLMSYFLFVQVTNIEQPFPLPENSEASPTAVKGQKPIYYFGVISRYPPTLLYQGYQPVIDYLNTHTPFYFELKLDPSYQQTLNQLAQGKMVAAFFGSYLFAREREKYQLRCILKPLNANGQPVLYADLIVAQNSPIQSLKDLKGKRLALPSPDSFSANWLFLGELQKNGLQKSDLDSVHYFAHHHTVVYEVLKGNFDAGVVKNVVSEAFRKRGIRIVARSEAIPSSPIVVAPQAPKTVVQAIQQTLLQLDVHDPQTQKMLQHWDRELVHGFVPASNEDYIPLERLIKQTGGRP